MLLVQNTLFGIAQGGVYALLALGIVLVYRATGVFNFAQISMALLSTVVYYEVTRAGAPVVVAFATGIAAGAAIGVVMDRVFRFPNVRSAPAAVKMLVTIGMAGLWNGIVGIILAKQTAISVPALFSRSPVTIFGARMQWHQVGLVGVTAALAVTIALLLKFTAYGIALRAVAQNRMAASLAGVPEDRVTLGAWIAGSVLAAIGGMLYYPLSLLDAAGNFSLLLLPSVFAAALLGGLVSIPAAAVGGILLAVAQGDLKLLPEPLDGAHNVIAAMIIVVLLLLRFERFFASEQEVRAIEEG